MGKTLLLDLCPVCHPAVMTFFGIYASDLGLAHAAMFACPEQPTHTWASGRTSAEIDLFSRRIRKPQSA